MRVVSAVILAPLFLGVVWYGGPLFLVVLAVAALLILNEWSRISRSADFVALFAGFGLVVTVATVWWSSNFYALMILLDTMIIVGFLSLLSGRPPWSALGVLYAGLPVVALAELRLGENGLWAVAVILALTWATDIAAYFVGRTLGGPKLWPRVSPKKTWSGAIGGLVGAAAAACAVSLISGIGSPMAIALVAIPLSIASQLGDLAESAFKRHFGVKDSGALIPGHGGIMDRVDGLVAAAVVAYVVGLVASGGGDPSLGLATL
ncbi:phosphatidate cytidylyltransferase [Breoghania corrubedonensis]|uniref:phosphatidate cytidylyltransferase n=1 Tax=Breoghania corrubedonensis TaxID=665038 RepID=UPI001AEC7CB7|nr:phosphatidate cytidylyltransferase [Breoghania corrubedonensis]